MNLLTAKEIKNLNEEELRYKIDELQCEVKRLNRMLVAVDIANQYHMDFIVSINQDLSFFKWVKEQKKGGVK